MPGLVAAEFAELRLLQNLLHGVIDVRRSDAGARHLAAFGIGGQHRLVEGAVIIGDFFHEEGARDVGTVALIAAAEIEQQRIARLDVIIGPRMGMRLCGIVARRHDGREGQPIGAMRKQIAQQDAFDRGFGHADLDLAQRCLEGGFRDPDGLALQVELIRRLVQAD